MNSDSTGSLPVNGDSPTEKASYFRYRQLIGDNEAISSVDELVLYLKEQVPTAHIILEKKKKKSIIHLVDKQLAEDPNYILNRNVNVTYKGTLNSLPNVIGDKFNSTLRSGVNTASAVVLYDFTSQADVKSTRKPVRTVLTDAIPDQDHYSRIMWTAVNRRTAGTDSQTTVQYLGKAITH